MRPFLAFLMSQTTHRYFIINKPHNMLSQFIGSPGMEKLGDLDFHFPDGIHAIGRLDKESEGLLILTTNKKVTRLLFNSKTAHRRTYLVMVKNAVSPERLQELATGVSISGKAGIDYTTPPCEVSIVEKPTDLFKGTFEYIESWPHTWLMITIYEGKYHQVRKMVSAVHHRCQRLIRVSIEDLELNDLQPGCVKEIEEQDFFERLKIVNRATS